MQEVQKIKDTYRETKDISVLTENELKIPGLCTFGKSKRSTAVPALPPHIHMNSFEITFLVSGSTTFSIDETDYYMRGNDIFITQPDQVHHTNNTPIHPGEMYWFQIECTPDNLLYMNHTTAGYVLEQLSQLKTPLFHTDDTEILFYLKSAFKLCEKRQNHYLAGQYITLLLFKLIELSQNINFNLTSDIERAVNYIMEHIEEDISLETLMEISHLSIARFKQKFKKQVGFSPRHFINYQKTEYAKRLLLDGKTVTETASIVGFDNCYFSVVFKRFNMCSPTEFIEKHRKIDMSK